MRLLIAIEVRNLNYSIASKQGQIVPILKVKKYVKMPKSFVFQNPDHQIGGVIKAVKSTLKNSGEVTTLWVTHRLEELEYADGAFCMEGGKIIMQGDASTIFDFINGRQSPYTNQINS